MAIYYTVLVTVAPFVWELILNLRTKHVIENFYIHKVLKTSKILADVKTITCRPLLKFCFANSWENYLLSYIGLLNRLCSRSELKRCI